MGRVPSWLFSFKRAADADAAVSREYEFLANYGQYPMPFRTRGTYTCSDGS
jgi:hypothetical protein